MVAEGLIQWLEDLYANDKELMPVIIGLIGGWFLSKLLPAISSYFSRFITLIGKKLGGRLSHKSTREAYLNWLVYKTQDLNLTGVIGSGEKPKLEQIFISLRIVTEQEKLSKKTDVKSAEMKKPFWETFFTQYQKFLVLLILPYGSTLRNILQNHEPENTSKENIFKPDTFWKIYQIFDREGIDDVIVLIGFISIFWIIPIYSLLWSSNIYTLEAFLGSYIWSSLIILGLSISHETIGDIKKEIVGLRDIILFSIVVGCWAIPIILIYNTIQEKVIHGSQSPLAIVFGVTLGITSAIMVIRGSENLASKILDRHKEPIAKDIGEIFSKNNYIAILGKPGSGKSTLSQFLTLTFAQEKAGDRTIKKKGISKNCFGTNEWYLPIFIPLREISKFLVEADNEKYDNLILEAFRQKILPSNIRNILGDSYIYHMLKNKKCLFLLDGLDEVQNIIEFNAVVKEINGLISRFPENKVIVTSRRSGWRGGIGTLFNVFEIEDLNNEEIFKFIDSWYNAIEDNRARISQTGESKAQLIFRKGEASEKANKLKQALSSTNSIRRIAENPLLLSIICFVHYNKTLPKERLRLYQDCNDLLLVQWDEEKGLAVDDTNLTLARKEDIIQEIAFSFHTGKIGEAFGRKEATGEEIIPIVEKKLKEFKMDTTQAESLFQKLIERSGIIVITDKYANKYSFSHLTFQEFYSATYTHQNKLDIFKVVSQGNDNLTEALNGWWREVILLYCLLIKDPTEIIEKLYCDSDDDILQQNIQLAVQCLDESVKVTNQEVRKKIIEKVFWIRTHGTSELNIELLDSRIKSYLIKFAQSPFFYRYVITNKIMQVKSEDISFLILKILQLSQSADRHVRLIAVEALDLLALKFDISQATDSICLNDLLTDPDQNIQRATAKLILDTLPRPLEDNISLKLFKIFSDTNFLTWDKMLIYLRHLEPMGIASSDYIDDKLFPKSAEEGCKFLKQIIETSSEGALDEIQDRMGKIVYGIFNKNVFFSAGAEPYKNYGSFVCAIKSLIQLDDEKLKEVHKSQLLEALLKGNVHQQIFSIFALSELYSSDAAICQLILDRLEAPHSDVRNAVITSLNELNMTDDEFVSLWEHLENHRKPLSKYRIAQNYITQILIGRGKIGLNKSELDNLELYFNSIDKNHSIPTSERPRFDEMENKIDEFLRKKELNKIIKDYSLRNSNEKYRDEDNLLECLELPEIYLNDAAFNVLLEEKMI